MVQLTWLIITNIDNDCYLFYIVLEEDKVMNISLTPELDKWINEKVKSGLYNSASEVIREGLRLLVSKEEQKKAMLKDLQTELLVGIKQLDANKSKPLTEDLLNSIKQNARKNMGV